MALIALGVVVVVGGGIAGIWSYFSSGRTPQPAVADRGRVAGLAGPDRGVKPIHVVILGERGSGKTCLGNAVTGYLTHRQHPPVADPTHPPGEPFSSGVTQDIGIRNVGKWRLVATFGWAYGALDVWFPVVARLTTRRFKSGLIHQLSLNPTASTLDRYNAFLQQLHHVPTREALIQRWEALQDPIYPQPPEQTNPFFYIVWVQNIEAFLASQAGQIPELITWFQRLWNENHDIFNHFAIFWTHIDCDRARPRFRQRGFPHTEQTGPHMTLRQMLQNANRFDLLQIAPMSNVALQNIPCFFGDLRNNDLNLPNLRGPIAKLIDTIDHRFIGMV